MSADKSILGMRPKSFPLIVGGGALFAALALTSCSSDVSRFEYPMFAANEEGADNAALTTASVDPVPSEPVASRGQSYRNQGYSDRQGRNSDRQVTSADLPPARSAQGRQPSPARSASSSQAQPSQATQQARSRRSSPTDNRAGQARSPQERRVASLPPSLARSAREEARSARESEAGPAPQPAKAEPAPAPEPVSDSGEDAGGTPVTVRRGDTLIALARRHDTTVEAIKRANGLSGSRLEAGQEIVIPGGNAASEDDGDAATHTVRLGDSLFSIARKHGIGYEKLAAHNDLRSNAVLQPGQVLKIPGQGNSGEDARAPVRVASRSDVPVPNSRPETGPEEGAEKPAPKQQTREKPAETEQQPVRKASLPQPQPLTGNAFRWPARGRVISGFGPRPDGKHNDGINIAVPLGTSVRAVENGVVAYAGSELEGYGNLVLIRHADDWVSAYAHNDELTVKRGDEVRRGQVIAKAGKSGSVSRPQLHFELRKGSQPIDPLEHMAESS